MQLKSHKENRGNGIGGQCFIFTFHLYIKFPNASEQCCLLGSVDKDIYIGSTRKNKLERSTVFIVI